MFFFWGVFGIIDLMGYDGMWMGINVNLGMNGMWIDDMD